MASGEIIVFPMSMCKGSHPFRYQLAVTPWVVKGQHPADTRKGRAKIFLCLLRIVEVVFS